MPVEMARAVQLRPEPAPCDSSLSHLPIRLAKKAPSVGLFVTGHCQELEPVSERRETGQI